VVELDMSVPFTAARAKNEGVARLRLLLPDVKYVQFVDGDCEVVGGWLEQEIDFMNRFTDVAVVCGRCRERYPEQSIYNMICDIDWNTPIGLAKSCGGNAMILADAFFTVGGFRPQV
jgi:hypothetical protein